MTGDEQQAPARAAPSVIIIMGVAGAGKTTVGQALAGALGWPFADADDFHSDVNIERMRAGIPLTDRQRGPWLTALGARIVAALRAGSGLVLACSALRQRYRDALVPRDSRPGEVVFVHLAVPPGVLAGRLRQRTNHFATDSLLESQLRTLETPVAALRLDGDQPVDVLVRTIRGTLGV